MTRKAPPTKRCSVCRKPVAERAANPDWPFCSERCRMVDLGRWMTGDYVISSPVPDVEEGRPRPQSDDEDLE
jgi:endogenous inhibitor of DNA gyrase (YacG/DUF329 family)